MASVAPMIRRERYGVSPTPANRRASAGRPRHAKRLRRDFTSAIKTCGTCLMTTALGAGNPRTRTASMLRTLLAPIVVWALHATPVAAQPVQPRSGIEAGVAAIGLPLYSSDGVAMGSIAGVSARPAGTFLIAEFDRQL